jgi:AhpD family alkylhydroperoxidase
MADTIYHPTTPGLAAKRRQLAPQTHRAFEEFSRAVFAEGALDRKTKQLIAVAVAHVTQCPYCIHGHTELASQAGATPPEIMESIWVAAEMRAGAAFAHATLALRTLSSEPDAPGDTPTPAQPSPAAEHRVAAELDRLGSMTAGHNLDGRSD